MANFQCIRKEQGGLIVDGDRWLDTHTYSGYMNIGTEADGNTSFSCIALRVFFHVWYSDTQPYRGGKRDHR